MEIAFFGLCMSMFDPSTMARPVPGSWERLEVLDHAGEHIIILGAIQEQQEFFIMRSVSESDRIAYCETAKEGLE